MKGVISGKKKIWTALHKYEKKSIQRGIVNHFLSRGEISLTTFVKQKQDFYIHLYSVKETLYFLNCGSIIKFQSI